MKPSRALAVFCVLGLSCGGTTGGQLIHIPFQVGGVERPHDALPDGGLGPYAFTTPLGWNVQLTEAIASLGPFYFNVSPPQTHTFHSGVVILQVTQQVLVNALDPSLMNVDAGADGETGTAVAVEIELYPPDQTGDPTLTSALQNPLTFQYAQAMVRGVADRVDANGADAGHIPFNGYVTIDTSLMTAQQPLDFLQRVSGAACGPADGGCVVTGNDQVVQLRVDPAHWFDTADFLSLVPAPRAFADGGVEDAGPPPTSYTWKTTDTFNAKELMVGLQSRTGAYNFAVVAP